MHSPQHQSTMVLPASPYLCSEEWRPIFVPGTARTAERLFWVWISSHSFALKRNGWKINHKRVERIMREVGLTCRRKPRSVHTTDSKHGEPVYPNLIRVSANRVAQSVLGGGPDLCARACGLCVSCLHLGCLLPYVFGLESVSQDGEQFAASSDFRWP